MGSIQDGSNGCRYGSYETTATVKAKGIKGILKYSGYEKKKEKVTDKNRYQLRHMERMEDGTPVCPAGHVFEKERIRSKSPGTVSKNDKCIIEIKTVVGVHKEINARLQKMEEVQGSYRH